MGVVYRVRQVSLDRVVALKLLPPSISDDPAFADRFMREAKTMARLDHPNIVRVHEFGETEGRYYLVMEYVDGSNLRQVMEGGGLVPKEALAIVPQVCDALQYAHDRGVVHRDIKPENVLIDRTGRVKITDFGLAKLVQHDPRDKTLTAVGQVMGTPQYMAPEQYKSPQDVDHRADIYSLGVVFYEMLTGDVPMGRFDPPSEKVEVDVRLDEVVLRTLEKERERRYQRVDAVGTEVTSIVDTPGQAVALPPAASKKRAFEPEPVREPGEARWSKLAVAGFLCVPGVLLVPVLAMLVSGVLDVGDIAIAISMGLAFLVLFLGFFLSLAGWITTSRAKGALKGHGLAVAGTIAPIPLFLLLMAVFGAVFFLVRGEAEPPFQDFGSTGYGEEWVLDDDGEWTRLRSSMPPVPEPMPPPVPAAPPPAPPVVRPPLPELPPSPVEARTVAGPGPTLIGVPEAAQDEVGATVIQIEDLWAELLRITRPGVKVTPKEAGALIAPIDRERIMRMRAQDIARLKEQGALGLPMPPSSIDLSTLDQYRLDTIDFTPAQQGLPFANVTARAGEETLTFDMVWNGREPHFAVAPVRHSSDASIDKPELVKGAPKEWSRLRTRNLQTQVEMLWSIYRGFWEPGDTVLKDRVPRDTWRWFLPSNLSDYWQGAGSNGLPERGRYGDSGLLFLDATMLPVPLDHYTLTSIALDDPANMVVPYGEGNSATVVAEAGKPTEASLTFAVVWYEGRWWLDLTPVKK